MTHQEFLEQRYADLERLQQIYGGFIDTLFELMLGGKIAEVQLYQILNHLKEIEE